MNTAARTHVVALFALLGLLDSTTLDLHGSDLFIDVAEARGIDFIHESGAAGARKLVETMGAGAAWLDFDGDGFLDLYLVQGGQVPGASGESASEGPSNVLYRSIGGKRFEDVSREADVADRGYGMGVAVGDFDADGSPDIFVTNYGRNALYRNQRDGTFRDVTAGAGVGGPELPGGAPVWSTSATWTDFDGDGLLDLYVANYLAYDTRTHGACDTPLPGTKRRVPSYCHPNRFAGVADTLYRNLGDGSFRDVSRASGIARVAGRSEAKGLGVVASDFDGDGDADILVANDTVANTLWRNLGGFRFEEVGLETGFALNGEGSPEAGMGITRGDVDADGDLDYLLTHFSRETNTLYLSDRDFFVDATSERRLARPSYLPLGFGARFLDHDRDGDLDLYVANGHILDNAEALHPGEKITHAQPDQLFENTGKGVFREVSKGAGPWFQRARVGRSVIEGDFDNDGDGDLLVTNVGARPVLLENRSPAVARWIGLDLRSARAGHGARVEIEIAGRRRVHEVQRDGGYLGSHDPRVRFGIPAGVAAPVVRIRWSGEKAAASACKDLEVGRYNRCARP